MELKVGVLSSQRGTHIGTLLDAVRSGALRSTRLSAVISNNAGSQALELGRKAGVPTFHLSSRTHEDPHVLDSEIATALTDEGVNVVLLLGYLRLLGPATLRRYHGRIFNIHPSLLPRHGGLGMYGDKVHQAVIAAGDVVSGATIHVVDEVYDHGRIVAQKEVMLRPPETPASLSMKIFEAERELLTDFLGRLERDELVLPL